MNDNTRIRQTLFWVLSVVAWIRLTQSWSWHVLGDKSGPLGSLVSVAPRLTVCGRQSDGVSQCGLVLSARMIAKTERSMVYGPKIDV